MNSGLAGAHARTQLGERMGTRNELNNRIASEGMSKEELIADAIRANDVHSQEADDTARCCVEHSNKFDEYVLIDSKSQKPSYKDVLMKAIGPVKPDISHHEPLSAAADQTQNINNNNNSNNNDNNGDAFDSRLRHQPS